ncbi:MAG: tryptophan synthase subunit alpha [Gammaproteobacteria bacterium]|nr:tryptophan synthase subunit alpha [Pseudomonadales bacterium]MCP5346062.1 tryptophan synthase subunit alpha [Pseudomonadales bacterium]
MSRISQVIKTRQASGGKIVVPYLVAGDPDLGTSLRLMHALVAAGSDIIELGVPFSDPSSDGEVIQKGAERALARGTTLLQVIDLVAQFRTTDPDTPVVLMGYLNPVEILGYEQFVNSASEAGVDGVLLVDMPPTESPPLAGMLADAGLDLIFLVAPTTSETRARLIASQCTGYLYYVSLKGVTGAAISDTDSIARNIGLLKTFADVPIVIGFGIKDENSAASLAKLADGVVIGSALVQKIAGLPASDAEDTEIEASVSLIGAIRKRLDQTG